MTDKTKVLVLCTGNSARSQMLEAILTAKLGDKVHAESAGTLPAPEVHPLALKALAEIGIDHADAVTKDVLDLLDRDFDVAITVCGYAKESCPVLPGVGRTIHIGYPDPAGAEGSDEVRLEGFRSVRDSMIGWVEFLKCFAS